MQGSGEAPDFPALEAELGHAFRNRTLLSRAITHKSWAFEKNLHETQYLDRKLDNRFDLLERMLFDNLQQDRNRIATVEGKVKTLMEV